MTLSKDLSKQEDKPWISRGTVLKTKEAANVEYGIGVFQKQQGNFQYEWNWKLIEKSGLSLWVGQNPEGLLVFIHVCYAKPWAMDHFECEVIWSDWGVFRRISPAIMWRTVGEGHVEGGGQETREAPPISYHCLVSLISVFQSRWFMT